MLDVEALENFRRVKTCVAVQKRKNGKRTKTRTKTKKSGRVWGRKKGKKERRKKNNQAKRLHSIPSFFAPMRALQALDQVNASPELD